jgi:hypothetical protein
LDFHHEQFILECKIWDFHGGGYEEYCVLGYYAMWHL